MSNPPLLPVQTNAANSAGLIHERLFHRASRQPNATAFRFLRKGDPAQQQVMSYSELKSGALILAAALQQLGAISRPVPVIMNPSLDFVTAFFGIILAGGVPAPLRTPGAGQSSRYLPFLRSVLDKLETRFVYCDRSIALQLQDCGIEGLHWLSPGHLPEPDASHWYEVARQPADLALVQFTSGSTGNPKGVCISHENLIANAGAIVASGIYGPGQKHLSWMPHYHDMGLIGGILAPVAAGVEAILMSPQTFIRSPLAWMRAIDHFRVDCSGGPNFAYDLVTRLTNPDDLQSIDLSCWRTAYCGAEPINRACLQRFARHLKVAGFREESLFPCYGMAETTLFVAGRHGVVARQATDQSASPPVSVGRTSDATTVSILNPDSTEELPGRAVGEVCVTGPGVSAGPYPAGIQAAFELDESRQHASVRTGDLGFMESGELHICGRIKDLVIIRGQNFYPQDIEHCVTGTTGANGISAVIAFAAEHEATEQLVLVLGIRSRAARDVDFESLTRKIRTALIESLQVSAARIVLIPAGEIPKTSSGKLQRGACKRRLLRGELTEIASWSDAACGSAGSLYPGLGTSIGKYESRNLRYRFDLESDIEWHRTAEEGRYFSDTFLRQTGVDLELLKSHQDAFRFFEWALALLTAQQFADLERAVLEWGKIVRGVTEPTRSLELLEQEEIKHIELFQRYSDRLQLMRPDMSQRVLGSLRLSRADTLRDMFDASGYHSLRHQHYNAWLSILFFEEFTLWIDETLKELGERIQPAWKQAHSCHRREESQHVITDQAYVFGLETTRQERDAWSRLCLQRVFEATRIEYDSLIGLTEEMFPGLSARLAASDTCRGSDASHFLHHRLLRRTRSIAPYAERMVEHFYGHRDDVQPDGPGLEPPALRAALRSIVASIAKVSSSSVTDTDRFSEIGLDSLGHVTLAIEIEKLLGQRVELDSLYGDPTIAGLSTVLLASDSGQDAESSCMSAPKTHTSSDMITVLNANGSARPLIWFFGGAFIPLLKQQLPAEQPLVCLRHPGSDGRPAEFDSVADLAGLYLDLIDKSILERGFYLGGYSMGGLIAYESARQLSESGNAPESLFLISPATPGFETGPAVRQPHIRNGSYSGLLRDYYRKLCRLPTIIKCHRAFKKGMVPASGELWAFLAPRYKRARDSYELGGYTGPVTLVHETGFPLQVWDHALRVSGLTNCNVNCNHHQFHADEFATAWLPLLNGILHAGSAIAASNPVRTN